MFSTRLSEFCTGAADSTRLTASLSVCSDTGSILSPFLPPPFLYTLQITSPAAQGYLHNCPVKGLSSSTQLGSNTLSLIRINCSMRREYVTDLNCPVNFPVWLGLIVIRYYEMVETNFCCELCASLSSKPNVERCISTHPYFDSCAEIMETIFEIRTSNAILLEITYDMNPQPKSTSCFGDFKCIKNEISVFLSFVVSFRYNSYAKSPMVK